MSNVHLSIYFYFLKLILKSAQYLESEYIFSLPKMQKIVGNLSFFNSNFRIFQ